MWGPGHSWLHSARNSDFPVTSACTQVVAQGRQLPSYLCANDGRCLWHPHKQYAQQHTTPVVLRRCNCEKVSLAAGVQVLFCAPVPHHRVMLTVSAGMADSLPHLQPKLHEFIVVFSAPSSTILQLDMQLSIQVLGQQQDSSQKRAAASSHAHVQVFAFMAPCLLLPRKTGFACVAEV